MTAVSPVADWNPVPAEISHNYGYWAANCALLGRPDASITTRRVGNSIIAQVRYDWLARLPIDDSPKSP